MIIEWKRHFWRVLLKDIIKIKFTKKMGFYSQDNRHYEKIYISEIFQFFILNGEKWRKMGKNGEEFMGNLGLIV